jgi:predicted glycosyltransferase
MHPPRIFFYVQHLQGVGHIKRASLLAKAWVDAGLEVTVASGGEAVAQFGFAGATLIQITPIKASDNSFSDLADAQGREIDEDFKQKRHQQLLTAFQQCQPDVLIIENYPFGRRQLRWELKPLLELAHQQSPKPIIASSIRDILQVRSAQREQESVDLVENYFDTVLVHGDKHFIPLDDSVPSISRVAEKLFYTGYVIEPSQLESTDSATANLSIEDKAGDMRVGENEVIVSGGGGATCFPLMATALKIKPLSNLSHLTWRFLIGPNLTKAEHDQLLSLATEGCIVEPIRRDFPQLLSNCRLSISQAGYNTIMNVLLAGCPSVLAPFEGKAETEQIARSRRLAEIGRCVMVEEDELNASNLQLAIDQALTATTTISANIDLNGTSASAAYLHSLCRDRRD